MSTTRDLLLAGTMIPVLIGATPGTATVAAAQAGWVMAQAAPAEDQRKPHPGGPPPGAPRPAEAPHPQAAPPAPRPQAAPPAPPAPRPQAAPPAPRAETPAPRPAAPPPAPRPQVAPPAPRFQPPPPAPAPESIQRAAPPAPRPVAPPAPRPAVVAPPAPAIVRPAAPATPPVVAPVAPRPATRVVPPPAPTLAPAEGGPPKLPVAPPALQPRPTLAAPSEGQPIHPPGTPTGPAAPAQGRPSGQPPAAPPVPGQGQQQARPPGQPGAVPALPPGAPGVRPVPGQPGFAPPPPGAGQVPQARPPGQPLPVPPPGAPGVRPAPGQPGFPPPPPPGAPNAPPPRQGNAGAAVGVGAAAGFVGGFLAAQGIDRLQQVQQQRQQFDDNGATIYREPGRTIIEDPNNQYFIAHDENERFRDLGYDIRTQRQGDQYAASYVAPDGSQITTYTDDNGRLLRRIRRFPDGRQIVLIDNGPPGPPRPVEEDVIVLPPPPLAIPQDRYIVDADQADEGVIYDTLIAPPVAPITQRYTLNQVRYSPDLRARMRSVDVDTVNFPTGSWTVSPDQAGRLSAIAQAIAKAIQRNPQEIFLVEGFTDAVGSPVDNLSLSDRRAQSVATILTQQFQVPPENLTTQGYGSQYLKVQTQAADVRNRRVVVQRITPLLQGNGQ